MSYSTNKLKKANEQLNESIATVDETEKIATQTLTRLREQRESIQRSKNRMEDVDKNLQQSEKSISSLENNCLVS